MAPSWIRSLVRSAHARALSVAEGPPSASMRLAAAALRALRRPARSPAELRRAYGGRVYPSPAPLPRSLREPCEARERRVLGRVVTTLTPRTGASRWHIVYTHGGSFVHALQGAHWNIVGALIRETGASVTVPLYPLAPEHQQPEALAMLEQVYRSLLERVGPDPIVLCGDSAGGNLALAQALRYRDQGLPPPARLVLFAPWLDLTLSDPASAAIEPRDVMLRCSEMIEFGRWWAGPAEPLSPQLSPLFADLRGLPPVQIFQGTDDILLPDARRLHERLVAAGNAVKLHVTPGGFHVFMGATFTPEARNVFRQIAEDLGISRAIL